MKQKSELSIHFYFFIMWWIFNRWKWQIKHFYFLPKKKQESVCTWLSWGGPGGGDGAVGRTGWSCNCPNAGNKLICTESLSCHSQGTKNSSFFFFIFFFTTTKLFFYTNTCIHILYMYTVLLCVRLQGKTLKSPELKEKGQKEKTWSLERIYGVCSPRKNTKEKPH